MKFKDTAAARLAFAANDNAYLSDPPDPSRAPDLCRQLQIAGVEPLLLQKGGRSSIAAAALEVDIARAVTSEASMAQLHDKAFALLVRGLRLSVTVSGAPCGPEVAGLLRRMFTVLAAACHDACADTASIEIAIEADLITPHAAWLVRRETLGHGPVYLIADGERMNVAGGLQARERCEQFWLQLWHLRDTSAVRAACASIVSSRCPLLSAEIATTILPCSGIQVPPGTAWVPMRLDLARFADAHGQVQVAALENALHCCVDAGDLLHDLVQWPTAGMRHDAWLNRRLAIMVTGLGDLAVRRKVDPGQRHGLHGLHDLLRWVQQTLQARSRQIAHQTSTLPALDLGDPSRLLPGGVVCDDWKLRWRQAVKDGAVRHRNLMVLSPWSVFPAQQPADMRYADLLPLVAHSDACSFSRPPALAHWSINEFRSFHQRAWAALQQRDANALIAERA